MPILKVGYNPTTKVVSVVNNAASLPGGSVNVGTFTHPDETYPDSRVIYHGVRDLLYKRSAANPSQPAMFPDNITNMSELTINNTSTPLIKFDMNTPYIVGLAEHMDLSLHVVATYGTPPFSYQWQKNYEDIDGQTDERLLIEDVWEGDAGVYLCNVTDAASQVASSNETEVQIAVAVPGTGLLATPNTIALSVAADSEDGKTAVITALPVGAGLGTLSIVTAPNPARATATLVGNVLTVVPVAAGSATSVEVTNGTFNVTIAVTVAA